MNWVRTVAAAGGGGDAIGAAVWEAQPASHPRQAAAKAAGRTQLCRLNLLPSCMCGQRRAADPRAVWNGIERCHSSQLLGSLPRGLAPRRSRGSAPGIRIAGPEKGRVQLRVLSVKQVTPQVAPLTTTSHWPPACAERRSWHDPAGFLSSPPPLRGATLEMLHTG